MKWIYGKSGGVSRLFNPQYISAVDFNHNMFFTCDTSGAWNFEEDDVDLLVKLTGRSTDEEEPSSKKKKEDKKNATSK